MRSTLSLLVASLLLFDCAQNPSEGTCPEVAPPPTFFVKAVNAKDGTPLCTAPVTVSVDIFLVDQMPDDQCEVSTPVHSGTYAVSISAPGYMTEMVQEKFVYAGCEIMPVHLVAMLTRN